MSIINPILIKKSGGDALSFTPEDVANKVTSFQATPDDTHYISEKLAKDSLDAKMENPMTTAGDVIYGGLDGTPTRLQKGTAGQVLKMKSGSLSWENDENTTYTASDFDIKDLSDTNNKKAGWDNKQDKIQAVTKEIKTTDWSNKEVTVSVAGITPNSIIWVSPERDSFDDYTDAGILGVSQGTDEITFSCIIEPEEDITINIAFT